MKKIIKMLAMMLIIVSCTLFVSAETEESKYEYHDSSWYLSEEEAKAFVGFVYDLSPENLEANTNIEYAIELLTGGYSDDPKTEKVLKIAFCEVAVTLINKRVAKYDHASVITSNNVIEWLKSEANVDEAGYELNDICNDFLDKLTGELKNAIRFCDLTAAEEKAFKELGDIIGGFAAIVDIKGKAEKYAKAAKAGVETVILTASSSRSAMYQYFLSYVKTRDLADSTVDGFELAMNYNVFALVNQGLYDPFLNWAAEDNQKVLNRWAELLYWFTEDVGGLDFINDSASGTTSSTLEPVEFVPGTDTYEGTCGDKVKWHLDASTGVLNIYGEGSMYDYSSSSKAPWYSYRQYINYVRITDGVISIGNYAFAECTTLDKVYLAADVYNIGSYAFYNCVAMRLFVVDGIVNNIGQYAFQNCKNLVYFNMPDRVTSISVGLFNGCTSLVYVDMPEDLVSIGNYAFYGCTSLESVTIPEYVTSIGSQAFHNCTSLESVTIPDSVTSIGNSAFYNCSGLESVTIGNSVTSIGYSVFYNCSSLGGSITIPDSVTSIGNYAFYNCSGLESVTIGNSVTSIGHSVFYNCSSLGGSITIPDSVTSIGHSVFYNCSSLESVTIPDGVISIGDNAFYNCSNLESVTIPDSVTSIGGYAFYNCSGLKSVTIPDGVTGIGKRVFYGCESLESITIPDGVTSIGYGAFYNCSGLKSVTIPDSVTSIGNYAFAFCTSLESVTIPDSVTSIGNYAFGYCSALEYLKIPVSLVYNEQFYGVSNLKEVVLSAGTGSMANYDEYNYEYTPWYSSRKNLTKLIIENGVTSISDYAFSGCVALTSVTIPSSVTSIGYYAFRSCKSLESITIPDGVTSIGDYAFSSCYGLGGSITIPDGVTSIGEYVFYGCESLESITIPGGVTSIGDYAFYGCESLESITIPDSVTIIGEYAFVNCTSLESVTIGNSVTSIGYGAFYNCSGISDVYVKDMETWLNIDMMESLSSPLFYGANLYFSGKLVTELSFPDSITEIKENAFRGCVSLKSITIPDSVTIIEDYAFYDCYGLRSITITDSVTSIGREAFYDCDRLYSVVLGDGVKSIGYHAFYNCDSIKSLVIPESLKSIEKEAFCYDKYNAVFDATFTKSITVNDVYYTGTKDSDLSIIKDNVDYIRLHYNYDGQEPHYSEKVITKATCTTSGKLESVCPCGYSNGYETIPATGHTSGTPVKTTVSATCIENGYNNTVVYCSDCNVTLHNSTTAIPATGHSYGDDNICDSCGDDRSEDCSCNCHKTGFMNFIWKILRFFYKLFKTNSVCSCGMAHY